MTLDITEILTGDTRRVIDFNGLNRERGVNGEKLISLNVFDTDKNTKSYPYVKEENVITFDGEEYVIKEVGKKPIGQTYYKEVVCIHKFFCDMREQRIYESYTQSFTFTAFMNLVFNGTGYTFEVIGNFLAESFENFGDGEDKLALFNEGLSRYSAEFEIMGTVIRLSKRKGLSTPTFKLLYNHNIKTIDYKQNTNNLSTFIRGFGKKNEDGTYVVTGSYTSPNASLFPANTPDGLRHAPPIKDERYTTQEGLDLTLEEALIDVPEVSITLSFADMRKYGYPHAVPNDGDDVYLIHEPFGLDLTVRIIKIVEYFDKDLNPIDCDVTLGNPRENITDQFTNNDKTLGQILDPNGRVRLSYLDEQTKRLSEALATVETELEFNNGIIARDKTNPNRVVILNSLGLCISPDGGNTITEAVTWQGFALSAGAIGQLSADNVRIGAQTGSDIPALEFNSNGLRANTTTSGKYAELNGTGVYARRGAIKIERPDGFVVVDDGTLNHDFSLQSHRPPFKSGNVEIAGFWYRTALTQLQDCEYNSLHHVSRYLKVTIAMKCGATGYFQIVDEVTGQTVAIATENRNAETLGYFQTLTVDLGIPTGGRKTYFYSLRTSDGNFPVDVRILRDWLEG